MARSKDTNRWYEKGLFKLANGLKTHLFVSLILVDLIGIWIPIVYTFLGVQCGLVKFEENASQFTLKGLVLICLIFLWIVISKGSLIFDEKRNNDIQNLENKLLEQEESKMVLCNLNNSSNEICKNKLSTLLKRIGYFISNRREIPPDIISDPQKQLESLAEELTRCLAVILDFQERKYITDLFTSIIYRFPQEKGAKWQWATSERGLSISDLLKEYDTEQMSTFQYLLKSKRHSIFKNSKQLAYENNQYVPDNEDEYDEHNRLKGSIACYQFEIKNNNKVIIEFVITITSYGQQFLPGIDDQDEQVQNISHNLSKVILPNYTVRAKIELCLLYLKYLNEIRKKEENCSK